MPEIEPQKEQSKPNYKLTMMKAANVSFEFGFMIALPLLAFVFAGKYLDKKFGTSYIVFIGIALALVSSTVWFLKRVRSLAKDLTNHQK